MSRILPDQDSARRARRARAGGPDGAGGETGTGHGRRLPRRVRFIAPAKEIRTEYEAGSARSVMMHDGSRVQLRKVAEDYEPTDAIARMRTSASASARGNRDGAALYLDRLERDARAERHGEVPLTVIPYEQLCPGNAELQKVQHRFSMIHRERQPPREPRRSRGTEGTKTDPKEFSCSS